MKSQKPIFQLLIFRWILANFHSFWREKSYAKALQTIFSLIFVQFKHFQQHPFHWQSYEFSNGGGERKGQKTNFEVFIAPTMCLCMYLRVSNLHVKWCCGGVCTTKQSSFAFPWPRHNARKLPINLISRCNASLIEINISIYYDFGLSLFLFHLFIQFFALLGPAVAQYFSTLYSFARNALSLDVFMAMCFGLLLFFPFAPQRVNIHTHSHIHLDTNARRKVSIYVISTFTRVSVSSTSP